MVGARKDWQRKRGKFFRAAAILKSPSTFDVAFSEVKIGAVNTNYGTVIYQRLHQI